MCLWFETGLHSEAQAGLKHAEILLPQHMITGIIDVNHPTWFGREL